jgi:hypothetical protein
MRVNIKQIKSVLLSGFLLLLLLCMNAAAQDSNIQDFKQKISKDSSASYLELLRMIFPDISEDGIANKSIEIKTAVDEPDAQTYEGKMNIEYADANWLNTDNGKRLMLVIKVKSDEDVGFAWGELNLIALYEIAKTPRLLDIVDVSGDKETSFWGKLKLHPKRDAFVFEYRHHNAGENFDGFAFIYVDKDKFKSLFDDFPYLYYGRQCKSEITETGDFRAVNNPRRSAYRDIVFNIKVVGNRYAEDCEKLKSKSVKTFRLRISWQHGAYSFTDGGAELKRLRREEKRLGFGE